MIRNNNNIVMSDWYGEQSSNGVVFVGTAGNPSGRITIQSPKIQYNAIDAKYMLISNYQGQVFVGPSQFYPSPLPTQTITQVGTRALDIVMFGCPFYDEGLSVNAAVANFYSVANESCFLDGAIHGSAPAENYTAQTLTDLSGAFDDLQRLGNLDLDLNFPFLRWNVGPSVSIVAPSNGAVYTHRPATVTITANASDGDGTVSKVEFYQGNTLIGTATHSPFTCVWTNVLIGRYELTTKAYDDDGSSTVSAIVKIRVKDPSTLIRVGKSIQDRPIVGKWLASVLHVPLSGLNKVVRGQSWGGPLP
jgi:hypothetical protein